MRFTTLETITKFDYSKVRFDKENTVVMMTSIKAPAVEKVKRQPLNLVAVLDISGSMQGNKINHMKKSMSILVDHLSENDKLGIVIFSTDFSKLADMELVTSSRKTELKGMIEGLHSRDTTNISGATLLGFEMIGVADGPINRVILFTDGLPNVGVSDIPGLVDIVNKRPVKSTLSTFGFGTDHNPELLQSMAKAGSGNYYYIDNVDKIMTAFAQELGGLISCYGQNIKIEAQFKPGVKEVDVVNTSYAWEYDDNNHKLTVRIPDIFAEEVKNVLAKVVLEPRTSALPREVTVADISVEFSDLMSKKVEKIESKSKLEFVKDGEESKDRDKDVLKEEAILAAVEAQRQAIKFADAGDFIQAQSLMGSAVCNLQGVGCEDMAHDIHLWCANLNSRQYNTGVKYAGMAQSCSNAFGRTTGEENDYTSNKIQRGMVNSFRAHDQSSGHIEPALLPKLQTIKVEPLSKITKKGGKKRYNPMTDRN